MSEPSDQLHESEPSFSEQDSFPSFEEAASPQHPGQPSFHQPVWEPEKQDPVEIADHLLQENPAPGARHSILVLRGKVLEQQNLIEESRQALQKMDEVLHKVTSPANRIGTFLGLAGRDLAHVCVGGQDFYCAIDPRLDLSSLRTGCRVLLNEAYAVLDDIGYEAGGPIGKVVDLLSDGRIRLGQEHGSQNMVVRRGTDLAPQTLKAGDEIRVDSNYRVAIESLGQAASDTHMLVSVPELPWEKIGGQQKAIEAIRDAIEMPVLHPELFRRFHYQQPKGFLLYGPPGCHRRGQGILMWGGLIKPVEAIAVGDLLMGPDSRPRQVQRLVRGRGPMACIKPVKGNAFVVNREHILTLVRSRRLRRNDRAETIDLPVHEWAAWSRRRQHNYKLFRTGVEFAKRKMPMDPYFLGLLLGDGGLTGGISLTTLDQEMVAEAYHQAAIFGLSVRITQKTGGGATFTYHLHGRHGGAVAGRNRLVTLLQDLGLYGTSCSDKHIPHLFKTACRADRLRLLAGLMDTDGSCRHGVYDFVTKSKVLAQDVCYVARSLDFMATANWCHKEDQNGMGGEYQRIHISGHTDCIPCRLARKQASPRRQIKDVRRTGFSVDWLPEEEYYGFTLHGDGRYLLDDFTVTHNCGKTLMGKAAAWNLSQKLQNQQGDRVRTCFFHIKGPGLLSMWIGETERMIREIFEQARSKKQDGFLPFLFIDEAESILGTRSAGRWTNMANTIVPMFCAEMDGIDSLHDLVIILTSNRADLIDPAILRPGRIDRKIKVARPDKQTAADILHIYLTPDLPLRAGLHRLSRGKKPLSQQETAAEMVRCLVEDLFGKDQNSRFLEVSMRSGRKEILHRGDLCSGAILASIVERAKGLAIKRSIVSKRDEFIGTEDLRESVRLEYAENDIFPPTDNTEDWLKLLDYDPHNVVKVSPIRRSPPGASRRASQVI